MDCSTTLDDKMFLTVKEVAQILRLSTPIVYQLCNSKGFPAKKIGGSYRISKEGLEKWINSQK